MLDGVYRCSHTGTPPQSRKQAVNSSGQTAFNPKSGDLSVQLQPIPISVPVGPRWAVGRATLGSWASPGAKWQAQQFLLAPQPEV